MQNKNVEIILDHRTRPVDLFSHQVWPSGKAEEPRFDTASALLSLQKGCSLWALSCDFVHHFLKHSNGSHRCPF